MPPNSTVTAVKPLPAADLAQVLEHTRDLWRAARGASFFITGGTGFFGMWLLESFARINDELDLGMRAVVLTRDPAAFGRKAPHLAGRPDLRLVPGDVCSFAFPAGRFDYAIHAATEASAKLLEEAPAEMRATIVDGTRRVLDFCAQAGVRKLLFTSSGAVYGRQPAELTHLGEDYAGMPDPLAPSSAYGEGKRVAEQLCVEHAHRHGFEAKMARCFAFVGPHLPLDTHFAIGNFIRDAMAGGPIRIGGDGTPTRSYLYAGDLAVWLWTLLFRGETGRAYNVGSGESQSIREIAGQVREALAPATRIELAKAAVPGQPVSRYVPDVTRAARELGLRPTVSLAEAVRRTAAWHGFRPAANLGLAQGDFPV